MIDIETYALAKAYTDKAIEGGGAIQGKNCVITEIEDVGNTHIVHFQWTLDDGTVETDTMTVEDGDLVEASETNGNIKINGVETQVYNDAEIKADIDAIDDIISTDEVTIEGNPLNFNTLSSQNAKSTILSCEPIQDLHGYDKPWVGGAGKNLINPTSIPTGSDKGITVTKSENGVIHAAGTNTSGTSGFYVQSNISSTLKAGQYTISVSAVGTTNVINFRLRFANLGNITANTNTPTSFTLSEGDSYQISVFEASTLTNANIDIYIQLESGTSASSWQPYTNECPISGRSEIGILGCGKNICIGWESGSIDIMDATQNPNQTRCRCIDFIFVKASQSVTVSMNNSVSKNSQLAIQAWKDNTFGGNTRLFDSGWNDNYYTFTAMVDCYITFVARYSDSGNISPDDISIQIEFSSTKTSYSPYTKSNDLTISLGQTVYGGTLDVENGVLVVDRGFFDLSTLTWGLISNSRWHTGALSVIKPNTATGDIANIITDRYEATSPSNLYNDVNLIGATVTTTSDFIIRNGSTTNTPIGQACYELATPITIEVTPHQIALLEGVNNISTDGDKITLTYRDGSVATLGDLTSAVDSMDSKIDESKILTDTATGDKYILVVTNGVLSVEQISN